MRSSFIYGFLGVQLVFFLLLNFVGERSDIYPFYSWNMFSGVRAKQRFFRIQVECLDDQCGLGLDLYDNRLRFQGNEGRQIYFTIRKYGEEFMNKRPISEYEDRLGLIILKGQSSAEFRLIEVKVDRINFARDRITEEENVVARRRCQRSEEAIQCSDI